MAVQRLIQRLPISQSGLLFSAIRRLFRWFREYVYWIDTESSNIRKLRNTHRNKRCFIIGNGPSLNRQDLSILKNEVTFVTNWFVLHPDYEKINPNYYCIIAHELFNGWESPSFNDKLYGLMNQKTKSSIKFFPFHLKPYFLRNDLFSEHEVRYLLYEPLVSHQMWLKGKANLNLVYPLDSAQNVVAGCCLPLAYYMGFKEVYLIGCDCDYQIRNETDQRKYFYQCTPNMPGPSYDFLSQSWHLDGPLFQSYRILAKAFEQLDCKVYNATAGGKLEAFPRVDFNDVV